MDASDGILAREPSMLAALNLPAWSHPRRVSRRASRALRAAEAELFMRHAEPLGGAVLELAARRVPGRAVHCPDFDGLSAFAEGEFDAVVCGQGAIDLLDDGGRRRLLDAVHRVLAPGGVLIFSSHNLACESLINPPARHALRSLRRLARLPRALRNHALLGHLQRRELGYGILSDPGYDYGLLRYHIGRDGQERQLAEHCFRLLECLTLDGAPVAHGATGYPCRELHYAAAPVH